MSLSHKARFSLSSRTEDIRNVADQIIEDESKLDEYLEDIQGDSRIKRQKSAAVVAEVARRNKDLVVPHTQIFVDALDYPEAQTRWEVLDILAMICEDDSRTAEKGLVGAEDALFDEDSGPLRLSAMRFLCRIGRTTEKRSQKVWPLINEAIQCYHGDVEYNDMLLALIDFSEGKLAKDVKKEFIARMSFDAENSKGTLCKRSTIIVQNLK